MATSEKDVALAATPPVDVNPSTIFDKIIKKEYHSKIFFEDDKVGDPIKDHNCWERPEDMDTACIVYAVSTEKLGSEVAGKTVAALAASSIVFRSMDPGYSQKLLENGMRVFQFADSYRAAYNDDPAFKASVFPFCCDFYCYQDEYNCTKLDFSSWSSYYRSWC